MHRIAVLAGVGLGVLAAFVRSADAIDFGLDDVEARARALAAEPFRDPRGEIPDWLMEIDYDSWREIRFRPEASLWRGGRLPFQVQFFHPGFLYDRRVRVNEVVAEGIRQIAFSPEQFDYGLNAFASRIPQDLGYAGFRLHHPLNRPEVFDEVIVFLGASYFRAVGRGQGFGLSARALAIDTAEPSGEEFPYFREFWLVRPAPGATDIALYALLDGPRVTGAYRVVVRPGVATRLDVEARVFLREPVKKLGLAPLTSMFFVGESPDARFDDYRPEVHDSEGLLLHNETGEWLWRPLANPRRLRLSAFQTTNPRGFGLLQRDRVFDHYQDLETRPERRPSAWVEPRGEWGAGHVELVEIPANDEKNDNIVAYWVPAATPQPGEQVGVSYTVSWTMDDDSRPHRGGRAVATRHDRGTFDDAHRFVVDFEGERLAALPASTVLRGVVTFGGRQEAADVELLDQQVFKNEVTGGWRLVFQVRVRSGEPVDIRAFLQRREDAVTETWTFTIEP
jgi:glucans biosynthesis protein